MNYLFRKVKQMIIRLILIWYALTKKHFVLFGYDREVSGKTGACCIFEYEAEHSEAFLEAMIDIIKETKEDLKESKMEGNV